ncbi:uncharacterized protein TA11925 [Theileria annulata]|uniref:G domain-containing protein n=1 Tax=Theileria annulata TaxID=5874 RepID=Q4UD94_THEAN|nr:uncharacterized protein TA11925 [Theileria annulata]CAI74945.1 hypothetical protein, conserved [Theileria annulata]|eukprot:XP_952677.1 hypothetical protein, conserved [Theileria annulata]
MNNKYVQRVDKQSGPSLDDFIYEKSISLNNEIKNSYNNYILYNSPISPYYLLTHLHIISYLLFYHVMYTVRNEFIPRTEFKYDRNIAWYTPEMARGMVNIANKKKAVDCVLEVRDARAPLSSANPSILNHYPNRINKLVILNKADLAPKHSLQRSRELLESVGNKVILINSLSLKKIIKIKRFVTSNVSVKFPALGFWLLVVGLPNVGKSSLIKALKHHSFKVLVIIHIVIKLTTHYIYPEYVIYDYRSNGIVKRKYWNKNE